VAQEAISNIRTVRAFANEDQVNKRYGNEVFESYQLSKRMGILIGTFQGLSTLALYGSVMFVLLYGGTLVNSGELTSGSLTSYMLYTINLQVTQSYLMSNAIGIDDQFVYFARRASERNGRCQ
jgi:ATP-binding cassette subfamily B (MDR/TAP) protein 8